MATITNYAGTLAAKVDEFRRHGQKEATKHRPPTDATYPDSHEVSLRTDAERYVANEQSLFESQVAEADRSALDARQRVRELEAATQLVLSDDSLPTEVEAELASERSALIRATTDRIAAEVELRGFRVLNSITSQPSYPDSTIWHWAVILLLVVVETVANAFFYENEQGLLGGFFVAGAVAAVNMGTAAGLGAIFRRKNLAATDRKVLGWIALPLFVILTLFCNALFASFRSVYQLLEDPTDPLQLSSGFREAWAEAGRIFLLDMQFGDFTSFLLFMTGLALSALAFWKGYTADDPYPGHSQRDRKFKQTIADEAKLQERVKQRLKDFLMARRTHVQGLASQPVSLVSLLHSRMSSVEHAERMLLANATAIERDYHLVLDAYRQANLAVRGIDPPRYFTDKPAVAGKVSADAAKATLTELQSSIDAVQGFQSRYQDTLNAKLNELQEQMSSILSSVFDHFLEKVEEEAKAKVQSGVMMMPSSVA